MASSAPQPSYDPLGTGRSRGIIAVSAVFLVLAFAAVAIRLVSRKIKRVPLSWDDYLVIGSLFFFCTFVAQTFLQVAKGGLGQHIENIPESAFEIDEKDAVFNQLSYALEMGLVRWSLCALLVRIFITRTFKRLAYSIIVFNGLWLIFSILIVLLRCLPISKNWEPQETDGYCINQLLVTGIVAGWGLLTEIFIWSLPLPMVWRLNTSRSNKLALTAIFALGIFDIAVGIVRVITVTSVEPDDLLYNEVTAIYWITIEPSVAIVVSCLPVSRPVLDKLAPGALYRSIRSRYHSENTWNATARRRSSPTKPRVGSSSGSTLGKVRTTEDVIQSTAYAEARHDDLELGQVTHDYGRD